MAIYVIADLHLSTCRDTNKSMEVFGTRWADYQEKLRRKWSALVEDTDTVIIPGDISWATTLEEAEEDLSFVHSLPGKKILMKGNHDFWWSGMKKMNDFCRERGFDSLSFLYHDATVAEDFILVGTRGWFPDDGKDTPSEENRRLVAREALRLGMSLDAAKKLREEYPEKEAIAFFHFPPVWSDVETKEFTSQLADAGIRRCYFGHIHGSYGVPACREIGGIRYHLISADYLGFVPAYIPPEGKSS